MTNLQQAAQQALEALIDAANVLSAPMFADAVAALSKALEQQAEPVAWAVQACSKMWRGEFAEIDARAEAKRIGGTCVAYPLYTAPTQRPWQGLTDEDWEQIHDKKDTALDTFAQGAVWAQARLMERNK